MSSILDLYQSYTVHMYIAGACPPPPPEIEKQKKSSE